MRFVINSWVLFWAIWKVMLTFVGLSAEGGPSEIYQTNFILLILKMCFTV